MVPVLVEVSVAGWPMFVLALPYGSLLQSNSQAIRRLHSSYRNIVYDQPLRAAEVIHLPVR